MATKYAPIKDPMQEKLKRLYNWPKLVEEDQKYLNFQFERYKLRNYHIMGSAFMLSFFFQCIPKVYHSTYFKYWTSTIAVGYTVYKTLTVKNTNHFHTIWQPYFEKYTIK